MRRELSLLVVATCGVFAAGAATAQFLGVTPQDVVINEAFYLGAVNEDWVELKNTGESTIDISSWWLCSRLDYAQLSNLTVLSGDLMLPPGEIVVVQIDSVTPPNPLDDLDAAFADIGLYDIDEFANPAAMLDFLQYGASAEIGRSGVARDAGLWTETDPGPPPLFDFVPTAAAGESVAYCGSNGGGGLLTLGVDFRNGPPTQGVDNAPCLLFEDGFESGDVDAWDSAVE